MGAELHPLCMTCILLRALVTRATRRSLHCLVALPLCCRPLGDMAQGERGVRVT